MELYNIGSGFISFTTRQSTYYYFIRDYSLEQEYEKEYNEKCPVQFYRDIFTNFVAPIKIDYSDPFSDPKLKEIERINNYADFPVRMYPHGLAKSGDETLPTIYLIKENEQLLNEYKMKLFMQTNKFKNAYEEIRSKLSDLGLSSKEYFERLYEEYKKLINSYLSINKEDKSKDNETFKNVSIDDIKFYKYCIGENGGVWQTTDGKRNDYSFISYEYDGILRDLITNAKLVPEDASFYPEDALVCHEIEPIEYSKVFELINSPDDLKKFYRNVIYRNAEKEDLFEKETILRHIIKLNMI